jgi:predicted DNA-binding protein
MKTKPQKQLSLRINPETRADLDYLVERTGLKAAQVIRLVLKGAAGRARTEDAAAARKSR